MKKKFIYEKSSHNFNDFIYLALNGLILTQILLLNYGFSHSNPTLNFNGIFSRNENWKLFTIERFPTRRRLKLKWIKAE